MDVIAYLPPPLVCQVARSLTIFFSILIPFIMWGERKSMQTIVACVVVVLGFILGAGGEVNFTWAGTGSPPS